MSFTIPVDGTMSAADEEAPSDLAPLVGKRILVVDDDTQAALLLANVLEDLGAEVQTADTARRGLDLYARFEPDALVSDIGMAAEDGHWLIESIRRVEADRCLTPMPALAVTAYSRPEDRDRSKNAGFDGHLAKPVTARAVAYALAAALARRPVVSIAPPLA
jgi:CheY-like chemotaxis protein